MHADKWRAAIRSAELSSLCKDKTWRCIRRSEMAASGCICQSKPSGCLNSSETPTGWLSVLKPVWWRETMPKSTVVIITKSTPRPVAFTASIRFVFALSAVKGMILILSQHDIEIAFLYRVRSPDRRPACLLAYSRRG